LGALFLRWACWGAARALVHPSVTPLAMYVAGMIFFKRWLCRQSHNVVCSTAQICKRIVWQNVFIQTLQLELKTKAFLYLHGTCSTNMK